MDISRSIEAFVGDLRFGARQLRLNPGFTAVALLSLALGIGVNTAIFSLVSGVLLQNLPYPDPDRLVEIAEVPLDNPGGFINVSGSNYVVWRDEAKSFTEMGAIHTPYAVNIDSSDRPERVEGQRVTSGMFAALGIQPMLGRYYLPEEDRPDIDPQPVALISHGFWQRRFGGDPDVVGQKIPIDGTVSTILGVMPPGFSIFQKTDTDVWFPHGLQHPVPGSGTMVTKWMRVIARLKPGVSIEQANAEMATIAARLAELYPRGNEGMTAKVRPLHEAYVGGAERPLKILMSAVSFVLLIACANVAGLMMVQATSRRREVAIRSAIGAGRRRVVRQFLTESVLLALIGGAIGVLLAFAGGRALTAAFGEIMGPGSFAIDYRVLGFTAGVSVVTGLLFGLVPAIQGTRLKLVETLNESGRSGGGLSAPRHRMRSVFVVVEVALALILLIGAGLMINSFLRLERVDPGFDASDLVTFQIRLPRDIYTKGSAENSEWLAYDPRIITICDNILERLKLLPGVESVAGATWLPLNNFWFEGRRIRIPGRPLQDENGRPMFASYNPATPGFFDTMRIPLLRGRDFTENDTAGSPWVVLINKTMADLYWPGEDPIGQQVIAIHMNDEEKPREVVGIVGDVHYYNLRVDPQPGIYVPHSQQPPDFNANRVRSRLHMTYAMRTGLTPAALLPSIRAAVAEVAPTQPVYDAKTMQDFLDEGTQGQRFQLTLLGIFGAVALILSAIGIYGVMAYSVAQRTQEIGVRMAMGATPRTVVGMILRRGIVLTLLGLLIGIGGAWGLTRFIGSWLYDVEPTDTTTFITVCVALGIVAFVACLVPALRATRVDPVTALRSE